MRALLRPLTQCRQRVFGAEENTGQIDRGKPVPFLEARLLDALAEKDPGIVDQNVEAAELADSGCDCRRPILLPTDIQVGVLDERGRESAMILCACSLRKQGRSDEYRTP